MYIAIQIPYISNFNFTPKNQDKNILKIKLITETFIVNFASPVALRAAGVVKDGAQKTVLSNKKLFVRFFDKFKVVGSFV